MLRSATGQRPGAPPRLEERFRDLGDRPERRDVRVVHQDVDGPVLAHGEVDALLHLDRIGDVALEGRRDPVALRDGVGGPLHLALRPAGDHHLGAGVGERHGDAFTDALAGARDDRNLAFERPHRPPATECRAP